MHTKLVQLSVIQALIGSNETRTLFATENSIPREALINSRPIALDFLNTLGFVLTQKLKIDPFLLDTTNS